MAAYKFLDEVDTNRVFTVNRSHILDRLDAIFYRIGFDFSNTIKLSNLVEIRGGKRLPKNLNYSKKETNYLYLRVKDLTTEKELNSGEVKYITKSVFNILKRYEIKRNEIAFSIAGTIGKIRLIDEIPNKKQIILTENCAKLSVKENSKLIPKYLEILLNTNFVQKQIQVNCIQTTIPKLGLDRISELRIPKIPPIEAQRKIVNLYTQAYQSKQQKEQEAERLLAGIDAYLLQELGVTLPEQEKSLQSRIFTVNFSEVTGGRFDPFTIFTDDFKIEGGVYPNKKLWKIAEITKGQSITSKHVIEGEYPVIAGGKTSPYTHNKYNFQGNVITVSASGAYSGYAWYHTKPIFASDCSVIWSKNENELLTLYLAEVLKAKQKEIYNLQQGAGQPHVYPNDLAKLNIPTPEMAKQKEIADTISKLRAKVKQLKKEAKRLLEDAKKEVEQLILGE